MIGKEFEKLRLEEERFYYDFLYERLGIDVINKLRSLTADDFSYPYLGVKRDLSNEEDLINFNSFIYKKIDSLKSKIFKENSDIKIFLKVTDRFMNNSYSTKRDDAYFIVLSKDMISESSLEKAEFVAAHEMGHIYFGHLDFLDAVSYVYPQFFMTEPRCNIDMSVPDLEGFNIIKEIYPSFANVSDYNSEKIPHIIYNIFYIWQKMSEISSDMLSLHITRDPDAAMKVISELSSKSKNVIGIEEVDRILASYKKKSLYKNISHPPPEFRVKALWIYCNSQFFKNGDKMHPESKTDAYNILKEEFKGLMKLIQKHPETRDEEMESDFILSSGLTVVNADKHRRKPELDQLINYLSQYHYFPYKLIESYKDVDKIEKLLKVSSVYLRENFSSTKDLKAIFKKLIRIAIRDNRLDDVEVSTLLDIGTNHLGLNKEDLAGMILVEVAGKYTPE